MISLPLLIIVFILSCFLIFITHKFFLKRKFIDQVNIRSSHLTTATRSGGVSIFAVIFIISIYYYISSVEIYDFSILVPLALLSLIGLYDDIYKVDFQLKFIFQIIAAKIIIDNGYIIENLHGFMGIFELNRIFAQALTAFLIISIVNAINFVDGIDGLAASIIIVFVFLYEFFAVNNTSFQTLSYLIISSLLPLYYFNLRKNKKVFLGDSGSLFLGGLASVYIIDILSVNYIIKPVYDVHKLTFVISIFIYPILDITRVFFLRTYNGKSPFIADKNHLHHILLNKIGSHLYTTLLIIVLSLLFTVLIHLVI